jgi:hypothetical protein
MEIDPLTGAWNGVVPHSFDSSLAAALYTFFMTEGARLVNDFGCGNGAYTNYLDSRRISCIGYDGNPQTPTMGGKLCSVLDLSIPVYLNPKPDWILSLEVGEHIPREREGVFLQNLVNNSIDGVVLSWAVPGQTGDGHVNERPNNYIKSWFARVGWENDMVVEEILREDSTLPWFKNTLMVFRRLG